MERKLERKSVRKHLAPALGRGCFAHKRRWARRAAVNGLRRRSGFHGFSCRSVGRISAEGYPRQFHQPELAFSFDHPVDLVELDVGEALDRAAARPAYDDLLNLPCLSEADLLLQARPAEGPSASDDEVDKKT